MPAAARDGGSPASRERRNQGVGEPRKGGVYIYILSIYNIYIYHIYKGEGRTREPREREERSWAASRMGSDPVALGVVGERRDEGGENETEGEEN